jgi:hypothetical protein
VCPFWHGAIGGALAATTKPSGVRTVL